LETLKQTLRRIDGKGYKAYKEIAGSYRMKDGSWLHIDHVQGDPFAAPSRIRVTASMAELRWPEEWYGETWRRIALEDFLARELAARLREEGCRSDGSGKSGMIAVDAPGQQVLPRTAVRVDAERVELRLSAGLPAAGRSIRGRAAEQLLAERIPELARRALRAFDAGKLKAQLELADQQQAIRRYLRDSGYAAFVANGSILPRESGISDRPLRGKGVVPFRSPESLEITVPVPHREPLRGMGIKQGVTLIVGGGYHGKSTLLKALERGVYNHAPGDGREYVITDESAVKIRAEDGRSVTKTDISPFIGTLPFGRSTSRFSTEDASGSTSQAANIIEALEVGTSLLLLDEDTSATNFMIRDERMQRLVAKEKEPITPFVDKVRQLYEEHGVSTILVIGGSGDYFGAADCVIMMDEYAARDVTNEAQSIASTYGSGRSREGGDRFGTLRPRIVLPQSFDLARGGREKAEAKGLHTVLLGSEAIRLDQVEGLVDPSQTRAIAQMIRLLAKSGMDGSMTLREALDRLYARIESGGLDMVSPFGKGKHPGDLALPRKHELAAAINRLRTLKVKDESRGGAQ